MERTLEKEKETDSLIKENPPTTATPVEEPVSKKNLYILFGTLLVGLVVFYIALPNLSPAEKAIVQRIPRSGNEFRDMYDVIQKYSEQNSFLIHSFMIYFYIFLQSFGIPGTYVLSILIGAILRGVKAFITCELCSITGASICFLLSHSLGKTFLEKRMPGMLNKLRDRVEKEKKKNNLFWYTMFMRLTPIFPAWFVNLACPIVGVPFWTFFKATLFGYIPVNIALVLAGETLSELTTVGLNPSMLLINFGLGLLALLPTLFKKKMD